MSNSKPIVGDLGDVDYAVIRGRYFEVKRDDHDGEPYIVEVDKIPEEYWELWEDDLDE